MKKIITAIVAGFCLLVSCEKYSSVKTVDKDFVNNYEAFWNMVNENYCFLGTEFGNTKNVDWQAVYDKWMPIVKNEVKNEYELFNIIGKSLDVLKDGHIWMNSDFKKYSNNKYLLMPDGVSYYEENFVSGFVQSKYLNLSTDKDDYKGDMSFRTPNGFRFGTIERNGKKIAYIYHGDFTKGLTAADMKYIDPLVMNSDALIYDIRNNPGGSGIIGLEHAGLFFKEKTFVGYSTFKNGPGHDDFAEPQEIYAVPYADYDWSDVPTAVTTDREVYSTANLFTSAVKYAENVIQVGQISGGGGGMPMSHYLPNGWEVVFSSNVLLDRDKKHIEDGIKPDIEAEIGDYQTTGKDGIIEKAIEELLKMMK